MKLLIENWRKYLNEGLKIKEEYPQEFSEFLAEVESHKDDLWIVFDTETTGLGYRLDFVQITQIACIAFNTNGFVEGTEPEIVQDGSFNVKVKLQEPTLAMKRKQQAEPEKYSFPISRIFKMTNYGSKTAPFVSPMEAIEQFEAYLEKMKSISPSGNVILIAQNSPFDVGIIHACYERLGRTPPEYDVWDSKAAINKYFFPVVRTMRDHPEATEEDKRILNAITRVSKNGQRRLSASLGTLIKAFDIQNKGWHDALADVQMTMDMFENVVNYVRRVVSTREIDFSKGSHFNPYAGDPYYGGQEPKD